MYFLTKNGYSDVSSALELYLSGERGSMWTAYARNGLFSALNDNASPTCKFGISNYYNETFNDQLDKNFVKDLSLKLFDWTNERWIIAFSKEKGKATIKDEEKNKKIELMENTKKTELYKTIMDYFPDAELVDVKPLLRRDDK